MILRDAIRLGSEALVAQQFQALQQKLDLAVAGREGALQFDLLRRHLGDDRVQFFGVVGELLSGFGHARKHTQNTRLVQQKPRLKQRKT